MATLVLSSLSFWSVVDLVSLCMPLVLELLPTHSTRVLRLAEAVLAHFVPEERLGVAEGARADVAGEESRLMFRLVVITKRLHELKAPKTHNKRQKFCCCFVYLFRHKEQSKAFSVKIKVYPPLEINIL